MFELDHVFVATSAPQAALAELSAAGFTVGRQGRHGGQGTANAVVFFDNVYLEIVWVEDALALSRAALSSPAFQRTGLPERMRWPESGASPIGVSFRHGGGRRAGPMPVQTWDWPAPFLPTNAVPIPVAVNSELVAEPMVFASLVTQRPDRRDVVRQQALGLCEVTSVQVAVAGVSVLSPVLDTVAQLGIADFALAETPTLTLTIDRASQGRRLEMTALPLSLRY